MYWMAVTKKEPAYIAAHLRRSFLQGISDATGRVKKLHFCVCTVKLKWQGCFPFFYLELVSHRPVSHYTCVTFELLLAVEITYRELYRSCTQISRDERTALCATVIIEKKVAWFHYFCKILRSDFLQDCRIFRDVNLLCNTRISKNLRKTRDSLNFSIFSIF